VLLTSAMAGRYPQEDCWAAINPSPKASVVMVEFKAHPNFALK